jgi:hypothetical protein
MNKLIECKGTNCHCTDGVNHSKECKAEHDKLCWEAEVADHVNHGGWKCRSCGFDGQDNVKNHTLFCAKCARMR